MALFLAALLACVACAKQGDDEGVASDYQVDKATAIGEGIYDGEWTVDRQVVDTARLTVTTKGLNVRMPETYIAQLAGNAIGATAKNQPVWLAITQQGYSSSAQFFTVSPPIQYSDGKVSIQLVWQAAQFGSAIYDTDVCLWTIVLPVERIRFTARQDGETTGTTEKAVNVTLCYNARKRIR